MRDHLYRSAEIITSALFLNNAVVYLAGSYVTVFRRVLVSKSLIMTYIQVSLHAVVRNENFAMLIGTHRTRIYVDIRVAFLNRNFIAPVFQQAPERRRRNAFAQR